MQTSFWDPEDLPQHRNKCFVKPNDVESFLYYNEDGTPQYIGEMLDVKSRALVRRTITLASGSLSKSSTSSTRRDSMTTGMRKPVATVHKQWQRKLTSSSQNRSGR